MKWKGRGFALILLLQQVILGKRFDQRFFKERGFTPSIATLSNILIFDCVGALDGTHVRASVPIGIQGRFRGRKGGTTQNVLAAVTFDLKFIYVLASWEGSAHDSCILSDALSRPTEFNIPEGKFYLGDAGYGIGNGIISLYRGVWYHLKEYSDNPTENEKELFNLCHLSLRITVERAFGVLKKRFHVLDAEPYWSFETQVDVVLACCIIHNYVMGVGPDDSIMREMDAEIEIESINERRRREPTQREERVESREWSMKRDEIARAMWNDYYTRRVQN